jgi:hypothetical protein
MRAAILAVLAIGCARSPVPGVRFANAPAVRAVDDRRDVPVTPATREFSRFLYFFDGSFYRRLIRVLEIPRPRRAQGVNALDEVPDSTWFTNRVGVRDIAPDELRAAPGGVGSPEPHRPWTIHSSKVGGQSVGFIIKDARGEKFLLKFDQAAFPETETAAHVIVAKLLWACGYNVTEDFVVYLRREDLVLAPDAVVKDLYGGTHPLDRAELDRKLATIAIDPDGRIRGLASAWLPGKLIGGHAGEGVRPDDPNDRIPHELRRDLRGAYAIFAWLDHADVQEGNLLDTWIEDPRDPTHHHVKHFLVDFGKSLGFLAVSSGDPRTSHEFRVDYGATLGALVSAGTWERSWERRRDLGLRGVGMFDVATFDPGRWKAAMPAYVPFLTADRIDKFWGARIVMRFTREQLRAAVDAGKLTDRRAADYLVDTLVARQRATGRYWFARVNPLDRFAVATEQSLCFDDLAITYRFAPAATTSYTVTAYDRHGEEVRRSASTRAAAEGRTCVALSLADHTDGYTIVRIATSRPGFSGATDVHVARDPRTRAARVIGVWRP